MTTQLHSVGAEHQAFEQAAHPLSGGFMHSGRGCGLLTGATLAAGVRARQRFDDDDTAIAAALSTAHSLAEAFPEFTGSVDCREITGSDLTSIVGRLRYLGAGEGSKCGHRHLKWGSHARGLIDESLSEFEQDAPVKECANCAVATLRRLATAVGMEPRDAIVVAGLAGGIGLLGNVCGALTTGVFAISVAEVLHGDTGSRDSMLRGGLQELAGSAYRGEPSRLRLAFIDEFGSELCLDIVGRLFRHADDHSAFVAGGGCREVIDWVAHHTSCSLSG